MNRLFVIIAVALCCCLTVEAGSRHRHRRHRVNNIQAKISAVQKQRGKAAEADKPVISVYSNVKGPEPAAR